MPLLPPNPPLLTPHGSLIYYQGPALQTGPQPAILFFALSAHASLFEAPFNQTILNLSQQGIRVFSWDLPFHGIDQDPQEAMHHWAQEFMHQPSFVSDFLDLCQHNIDYMIEQDLVSPSQLASAGVSRGAFVATHLAARDARIKTILGFAPLTQPKPLEELKDFPHASFDRIALPSLAGQLLRTRLRFYIGNNDTRVGTDACYSFIRTLTETAVKQGIRSPAVELIIYPSIGYKGHGTPLSIFYDGAEWIKRQLLT